MMCFILIGISACSFTEDSQWIKTDNGVLLWVSSSDVDKSFLWEGESIDSVANGKGVLSFIDKDGKRISSEVNLFYGTASPKEIVTLNDGSQYIGVLAENKMEGFGVLLRNDELYIGYFLDSKPDGFLKLYKKNKLYYEGHWKEGAFDGEGTLYKEDGSIKKGTWESGRLIQTYCQAQTEEGFYDGYVLNGKPDGMGTMLYNDRSRYEGSWSCGKWSGKGIFTQKNDTLSGEFQEGKLNGDGVYKSEAILYNGEWLDNKPDGIGYMETSDSSYYEGAWSEGKRNGYGNMYFANSDSYFGDWEDNQFDGVGEYTFAQSGDHYYGEWKQGLQHGLGVYTAKEYEYEGNWDEGWINGKGRITYANHDVYEGNFVENQLYGQGYYQFSNGNSYEGEFVDGKFNGLGIFRFADGSIYEGEFQDGKIKGDGTLYYIEGNDTIAITANWDGTNKFPKQASVLFSNGDLYEGELVNGFPTENGVWTTEAERNSSKSTVYDSAKRANEFYKKHRDTWNKVVKYTSIALSVVEVAAPVAGTVLIATGVGAGVGATLIVAGKAAGVANMALNAADAAIATTSAGIDAYEAVQNGEDATEALTTLGTELAVNAAFIVAPKALKSLPTRKAAVLLSASATSARGAARKSAIAISKSKPFDKIIRVSKNQAGQSQKAVVKSNPTQVLREIGSTVKKKFESTYLKTVMPRTLIYKELQRIKAKGPIKLKKKDFDYLMNGGNPRPIFRTYTGNKASFLEFFIRLADGDKKQVEMLLNQPGIKKYVNNAIRTYSGEGGYHEWLMTSNFKSFLLDDKWGKDGHFLAVALPRFTQETSKIRFKNGGGHVAKGRPNSPESVRFHNELAEVIHKCNSKEELFVEIRAYAKKVLDKDMHDNFNSLDDFNKIFKKVLETEPKIN